MTIREVLMGRFGRRKALKAKAAGPPSLPALSPAGRCPGLGTASAVGPVRRDNQDRVAMGLVGRHAVCAMADGVGGLTHGGEAADVAVQHAYACLERALPEAAGASAEGVRTLLLGLVWGAATRLACEASATGRDGPDGGFRTTLVLAVALDDAYVASWIGDGGVFLLRADGEFLALVEPHKNLAMLNVLHASLGPVTEGRPSWAVALRRPGDLLVVATDGIADTVDGPFMAAVRAELDRQQGDASGAAQAVVDRLAGARDGAGDPVHSDNLTLALIVTLP